MHWYFLTGGGGGGESIIIIVLIAKSSILEGILVQTPKAGPAKSKQ